MASLKLCLCSLLILTTFITNTQSASCCLRFSKRQLPCQQLIGFTLQPVTATCDIDAVIFHIKRGGFLCADPSKDWTIRRMRCLMRREKRSGK